jgi:hypothetical protein
LPAENEILLKTLIKAIFRAKKSPYDIKVVKADY